MLNVGIIGLGGIARSHCEAIKSLDNVQVLAVADLFEEPRQRYMETYDIPKGYTSHTELLKDDEIDAVAVVLGHQLHHRLTIDSLNAGKHVLVEKPMAISLQQCDEMIEAADANDRKLMVGLSQHFYGTSLAAKAILDSGELGPLITAVCYMSKNWGHAGRRPQYRSRFHGGGMWLGNGVHVVDRLTWVMGSQAMSVSAAIGTRAHYQAADDSATAFIRYKNGLAGVAVSVGLCRRRAGLFVPGDLRERDAAVQPARRKVRAGGQGRRMGRPTVRRPAGGDEVRVERVRGQHRAEHRAPDTRSVRPSHHGDPVCGRAVGDHQ